MACFVSDVLSLYYPSYEAKASLTASCSLSPLLTESFPICLLNASPARAGHRIHHLSPGYIKGLPVSYPLISPVPSSISSTEVTEPPCHFSAKNMLRVSQPPSKPKLQAFQSVLNVVPNYQSSLISLQFPLHTLLPGCTLVGQEVNVVLGYVPLDTSTFQKAKNVTCKSC